LNNKFEDDDSVVNFFLIALSVIMFVAVACLGLVFLLNDLG
jgi:hypothetical protein